MNEQINIDSEVLHPVLGHSINKSKSTIFINNRHAGFHLDPT